MPRSSAAGHFTIQKDSHLLMVMKYVESNPVRARLVNSAKDWIWSSHREIVGLRPRILTDEFSIELPKEWDKYVEEPITEKDIDKLHQSVNRQSPYGEQSWQMEVSKELGLESTIRSIGRPRKRVGEK